MHKGIEAGGMREEERKPRYRLMMTRHAERLPSGELSPEGIAHAQRKGEAMKEVEVLKAYASDHSSGRAFDTADNISEQSGITSPQTEKQYATRKVPDIQYDVLKPDLYDIIPGAKLVIEEATLKEIYSEHPDLAQSLDDAISKDREAIVIKTSTQGGYRYLLGAFTP